MSLPVLSTLIILPLLGSIIISFFRTTNELELKNTRNVALLITGVCFFLSLYVLFFFEHRYAGMQFEEIYGWVASAETNLHFGVDGLSIYFLVLTNLLMPICILISHDTIKTRFKAYLMCFLFLQSMINGFFVSLNFLAFYIFFEAVLIPMFLIIIIWGGEQRVYASFKMFLYTLFGSLFFLLSFLKIYIDTGETDLLILQNYDWPDSLEKILWLGCFVAFAIKVPMIPFHTWLPVAHTYAPTAGSVILAGILLKMGGYAMLRVLLPIFPNASAFFAPYVSILSVFAIIYASLIALAQTDMKKLIAYSSIAHMGFVTLGMFTFTPQGMSGSIVQMISHGLISSALFIGVGILYERFHTKEISFYGGVYKVMPKFGVLFLMFTLGSAGLPGTSGFIGEISVLIGTYRVQPFVALLASTGIVFSAAYGLWLYKRVFYGPLTDNIQQTTKLDLKKTELFCLSALAMLMIYFGFHAQPLFGLVNTNVQKIAHYYQPTQHMHLKKKITKIDVHADERSKKGI